MGVRSTNDPSTYSAEHDVPQSMPAGLETTVPAVPLRATVRTCVGENVAVTARVSFTVTVQAPGPEHAPAQETKAEPGAAVGVRFTSVGASKKAEQIVPQSIPAGVEVTVPLPVPARLTVRVARLMRIRALSRETAVPRTGSTTWRRSLATSERPAPSEAIAARAPTVPGSTTKPPGSSTAASAPTRAPYTS